MTKRNTKLIAQQNDLFRQNYGDTNAQKETGIQGQYCITPGISEMPILEQFKITMAVRNFNNFNKDNDPYGEHDMGSFKHNAESIFWKIDCYDLNYEYGSEDPSDLSKTRRVLTVMCAHEY
ncbi:hypothetical protein KORDIASMS9_02825 [Kordia sp. SMS9]|uniref:DUF3768 domain-containing protein n=1 Tax=Kordia sp. SMS9 TaxID=2282170 RepID=UPI000E0DF93E|nr:DUF3768 domain-containing protein [Kordia sp. SMS9]AXG70585.1 hypothetical protein KORDIASMS9_02825 [Kordia sp. SMS9]